MNCQQLKPIHLSNEEAFRAHCTSAEHQRAIVTKFMNVQQLAHAMPRSGCLVCDGLSLRFTPPTSDAVCKCSHLAGAQGTVGDLRDES